VEFHKCKFGPHGLISIENEIIEYEKEAPLMSIRDARILVIIGLSGTEKEMAMRLEQMKLRDKIRQKDIDRRYKI